jgi:hypothetical protein
MKADPTASYRERFLGQFDPSLWRAI